MPYLGNKLKEDRSLRIFVFSLAVSGSLFLLMLLKSCLPLPLFLLALLFQVFLFCLLGAALVWSIVYIFCQVKVKKVRAFLPLIMNAIAVVILWYFPFVEVWLNVNFMTMESARTEVVALVKSGQLIANKNGQVSLPSAYQLTSDDGQISVDKNDILFYTFRGIDNYGGFIYIPNNLEPRQGDIVFHGKAMEVKKFKQQWFWVSAT